MRIQEPFPRLHREVAASCEPRKSEAASVRDEARAERITMLTDCLLAAVAGGAAVALLAGAAGAPPAHRLVPLAWALVFLFTAAGAVAGAAFHGLRHRRSTVATDRLWRVTLYLSAPVGFFLMAAAALGVPSPRLRAVLLWAALAKLSTVGLMLVRTPSFAVVAWDSGLSLLVLGVAAGWGLASGGRFSGGVWVLAGVALSLAGAVVQQRGWRRDRHFDHNDLFHLAQAAACILFYQGVGRG